MNYWVFFCYGGCNDGSCGYGLQPCSTLEQAEQFAQSVMRERGTDDPCCTILRGEVVKTVDWETCEKPWLEAT